MNIAVVPPSKTFMQNKWFDIKDKVLNRDDVNTPYFLWKQEMENHGGFVNTIDMVTNFDTVDYILFFCFDVEIYKKMTSKGIENKLVYVAFEPEVVEPRHSKEGIQELLEFFKYVFTWNDDIVDGNRIFKIVYPYVFKKEFSLIDFEDRKLLANISGCKESVHPQEQYSERVKVIRYFEAQHPEAFDLFGMGWSEVEYPSYKGKVANKMETYHNYKFALCLENMHQVKGYITEKIFDCFSAGIIPIYEGASNIGEYIPENCFINYSRFSSLDSLYEYLINMSEDQYKIFLKNICDFLDSDQTYEFSSLHFCTLIEDALKQKENDFVFRAKLWKKTSLIFQYQIKTFFGKVHGKLESMKRGMIE